LDYQHRFLVDFHAEDVECWPKATRKAKLKMLDNAQRFYETQRDLQTNHQSTMEDWLNSYTKLRSGHMISKATQTDASGGANGKQ